MMTQMLPLAATNLHAFRQGPRTAEEYSVDFRWRVTASDWNDSTLCSQYRLCLSDEVKDTMVQFSLCKSLNSLVFLAININRHIRVRRSEREAGLSF